jgi:hypothetical protein
VPSETLFSYTCVETAKAVRDALRRIAPVFSCTERPNAKGRYTVEGSSDLIGLMSLAAMTFPRDSGKAASKALRSVIRLQDDEINTSVACRADPERLQPGRRDGLSDHDRPDHARRSAGARRLVRESSRMRHRPARSFASPSTWRAP